MDERAVSPVIGTVMVLAILTVVAGTMITVVWPQVDDTRARGEFSLVATQLAGVAADSRQMASLGSVGELRQANVAIAMGQLYLDHGHVYAVSTSIEAEEYQDAPDAVAPFNQSMLLVKRSDPQTPVDATDSTFLVSFEDADGDVPTLVLTVHRFDGRRWIQEGTTCGVVANLDDCLVDLGVKTIRDGPWRVQGHNGNTLVGEVFLFEQTRLVYEQHGRRDRGAVVENGALFTWEESLVLQQVPSLWHGGTSQVGGAALQGRSTTFKSSEMIEAAGRSTSTITLTTHVHVHFAHQQGASLTRVQVLSGPDVEIWHRHLARVGFTAEADPLRGVVYVLEDPDTADHRSYPFNLVHAELGFRMVVR
jgi:hypothetical protein